MPGPFGGDIATSRVAGAAGPTGPTGATGTPGGSDTQVQYNSAGAFAGSANFTWDNTNKSVYIGTPATSVNNAFQATAAVTGSYQNIIKNTSNNAGAYAGFLAINDAVNNNAVLKLSSTFTTAGLVVADMNYIVASTGDTLLGTSGAKDIIFCTGGTAAANERARLNVGTGLTLLPLASATPARNGDMVFQLTSNTSLVIKVKGSDGTVRSVTLTLA